MKKTPHRLKGYILLPVILAILVVSTITLMITRESTLYGHLTQNDNEVLQTRYITEAGINHTIWQLQRSNCTNYVGINPTPFNNGIYSTSVSKTDGSPVSVLAKATFGGSEQSDSANNIRIYQAPESITLQLNASTGKDALIDSANAARNFGNFDLLVSEASNQTLRSLIQFDLNSLPSSIKVISAQLELYQNNSSGSQSSQSINVHQLSGNWVEGSHSGSGSPDGATWQTFDGISNWDALGADFDNTVLASTVADNNIGLWRVWEVGALVNGWVQGNYTNEGFLIKAEGSARISFASKENAAAEFRPKLQITYACECNTACFTTTVSESIIFSINRDTTFGGLTFTEFDIVEYSQETNISQLLFDGEANGLSNEITALHILANGYFVLAANGPSLLGGVAFDADDLIEYDSTTNTARIIFNGSEMFSQNEKITSVHILDDGHIVLSTETDAILNGVSFSNIDLIEYDPISNSAQLFFDGSTTTLDSHITALHILSNGHLVLTASGNHTILGGVDFDDSDLIEYDPVTNTATRIFDGRESFGNASKQLFSVHIGAGSGIIVNRCEADFSANQIDREFSTAANTQQANKAATYFPPGQLFNGSLSPPQGAWLIADEAGVLSMITMDGIELETGYNTGITQADGISFIPADNFNNQGHVAIVKANTLYYSDLSLPANTSFTAHTLTFLSSAGDITYINGGSYSGHLAIVDKATALTHIVDLNFNLVTTLATSGVLVQPEGIAHLAKTDKFLIIDTGLRAVLVIATDLTIHQNYDLASLQIASTAGATAAIDPIKCHHFFGDAANQRFVYLSNTNSSPGGSPVTCNGNFRDEFTNRSFSNNNGSLNWKTDWLEINESNGATAGDVAVRNDISNYQLRIRDNDGGGEGVQREINLQGATTAELQLLYRRSGLDNNNDYVSLDISKNAAAGPWTTLETFAGPNTDTNYIQRTYNITDYISANTRIRLVSSPNLGSSDSVWFDNIDVQCAR